MTETSPIPAPGAPQPSARGRGLVIAGAILVGLYLVPAAVLIVWFLAGLLGSPQAASMIFVFWLFALLALTPLWVVGIALLGAGRNQQRGPVKGATVAWILAIGGFPAIGALVSAVLWVVNVPGQDSLATGAFATLLMGVPVLTVLALVSGAWLTWGRPRTA